MLNFYRIAKSRNTAPPIVSYLIHTPAPGQFGTKTLRQWEGILCGMRNA